ncbi:hypothetical protein GCM10007931_11730 [Vibrio algivorus]|uniref:Uncharacterized protein n=1 Tax=Vibrio algivorus TaxID=1667024 RepID=A0ABQ6EM35_9VIBR|nr:hypothetical protein GCM10007931_11730 [Vibrio algivorus]
MRKTLIATIQDSEPHREQLNLSRFLSLSVTEEQIYLIDKSMSMLRAPYNQQGSHLELSQSFEVINSDLR